MADLVAPAVDLGHDVGVPLGLSQGAYGPKVGVPMILEFLDRNGLRATFFVLG